MGAYGGYVVSLDSPEMDYISVMYLVVLLCTVSKFLMSTNSCGRHKGEQYRRWEQISER